jgi:hypothetical protein
VKSEKIEKKKSKFFTFLVFWGKIKISWCTFKYVRVCTVWGWKFWDLYCTSRAFNTIVLHEGTISEKIDRMWPKLHSLKISIDPHPDPPRSFKNQMSLERKDPPLSMSPTAPIPSVSIVWL